MKFVEDKDIYKKCGGRCCKRNSGIYSGNQLSISDIKARLGKDIVISIVQIANIDIVGQFIPNIPLKEVQLHTAVFGEALRRGYVTMDKPSWFLLTVKPMTVLDKGSITIVGDKRPQKQRCIHFTDTGCSLDNKDMPDFCKCLIPYYDNNRDSCTLKVLDEIEIYLSWFKYQNELKEIVLNTFKTNAEVIQDKYFMEMYLLPMLECEYIKEEDLLWT